MNKFLKFSTWQMIIQSRLTAYKNSKTDWCKERRAICKECDYNSKNKYKLTIGEKILMFLQLSKEICTACGCSILHKSKIKQADCGRTELGLESKWKRVNLNTKYQNDYQQTN
jgi:hypothetical protein